MTTERVGYERVNKAKCRPRLVYSYASRDLDNVLIKRTANPVLSEREGHHIMTLTRHSQNH